MEENASSPPIESPAIVVEMEKAADDPVWERLMGTQGVTAWVQDGGPKLIKYPLDLGVFTKAAVLGPYHARCLGMKLTAAIGNGYTIEGDPEGTDTAKLKTVQAVLSTAALRALAKDWIKFDNAFLEPERNVPGRIVRLHHARANTIWKKVEGGWAQRVQDVGTGAITWRHIDERKLVHLHGYSELSDHYGVPDYLPALLPVALAYEADDFHRKFYQNGAHAGLIIFLRGLNNVGSKLEDEIKQKFQETKGPGHFKNIFLAVKGKDVELEIKGVAKEAPVKDDYPEINKTSREKVLTAHGIPPRLASIILDSKSGAMGGKELRDEMLLFNLSWVEPAQRELEEFLNPLLPYPIKFRPYLIPAKAPNAQGDVLPPTPGEASQEPAEGEEDDDAAA
jgi:PBSX family phage portal protein